MGYSPSGIFGYSHMLGGYAGGQAEYARVPFADTGLFKIPDGLTDKQVVFLTDIFPPDIWRQRTVIFSPVIKSQISGGVVQSHNSQ